MTIREEVKTMALKDIFTMVKADRYTADGREELNKARDADVEDARRTYQIGEISEATGLQKTAQGWVKPKSGKAPGAKTGAGEVTRTQKEEAIRKELGLRGENDLDRFSDEQIEKMYQKTQQTPEQKKADFDKSKIGQAVNKGRQEFAAEKTRQKELASKTNAIGLQKTANGWVKPKTGKAPGAKTGEGKSPAEQKKIGYQVTEKGGKFYATGHQFSDGSQLHAGPFGSEEEVHKFMNGSPYKTTGAPAEESKPTETEPEDKSEIRISRYMDKNFAGKPNSERNAFYDFVKEKIYKSGKDPQQYLGQSGYSYPNRLLNQYLKEFQSKESKPTETPKAPKPTVQEYMKAKDRVKKYEEQYKKEMDDYEYMERVKANGVDTSIFNPMYGGKPRPLSENKDYIEELNKIKAYEATDSAPRILTGDTKIRVKKV